MAASKRGCTITPNKFTIYDSEVSDIDSDSEEWVSISTSTTAGTVPNQIALRPRTYTVPEIPPYKSKQSTPNPSLEREVKPLPLPTPSPISAYTAASSLCRLRSHLPTLKAIYIVNPTSIIPTLRQYNNAAHGPFSSFWNLTSSPIGLHIPSLRECYLRICGDCARSRIVLFCDGTWKPDGAGVCEKHVAVINGREGLGIGLQGEHERARDRELFEAAVHVVQPFYRGRVEKLSLRIFDMMSGDEKAGQDEQGFSHKVGCGCVR